jgi:SRSO17 transposase
MPKEVAALDGRQDLFLTDLNASLVRSDRHHWVKIYLQGLLMEGGRKSIEPLAGRIAGADVQSLRLFVVRFVAVATRRKRPAAIL